MDKCIIALIGEAGSGKDALLHRVKQSYNEIISCTTRPKREREQEGVNYYYYTEKQFMEEVKENKMLEYTLFNGWYYGTPLKSIKEGINIGVFNPAGIKNLLKAHPDIKLKVFYIYTTGKNRLLRQLNREENPNINEIIRRFNTDLNDFKFLDFDYEIIDNNEDIATASSILLDKIKQFEKSGF